MTPSQRSGKPIASLSLDADNLWSYQKTHGDAGWDRYGSYLDVLVPRVLEFLAEREVTRCAAVQAPVLLEFLIALTRRGLSPRSQARRWVAVRGLFRWLRTEQLVALDPTQGIRMPKSGAKLPELLGRSELEALIAAPGTDTPLGLRDTALLEFMYATGSRVSEAVGLRLDARREPRQCRSQPAQRLGVLPAVPAPDPQSRRLRHARKGAQESIDALGGDVRADVAEREGLPWLADTPAHPCAIEAIVEVA